jgi:hypothetical protein
LCLSCGTVGISFPKLTSTHQLNTTYNVTLSGSKCHLLHICANTFTCNDIAAVQILVPSVAFCMIWLAVCVISRIVY